MILNLQMVNLLLKIAKNMFGFCKNGESISFIDLYLINDHSCFYEQCKHIKQCFSSEIGGNKTGLLFKQEGGKMIIYPFKYEGLHTITDICNKYIL